MTESRIWGAAALAAFGLLVITFALAPSPGGRLPGEAAKPAVLSGDTAKADTVAGLLMLLQLEAPVARAPAPDFELPVLGGGRLRLQEFRGKVVLLNFWATWCGPCRSEMPAMERVYRTLAPRGFTIIAVNYRESAELVRPFVEELGLTFPIALDESGALDDRDYSVIGLPTTVILDRKGRVVARAVGLRDWESSAALGLFEALLAEPAPGS